MINIYCDGSSKGNPGIGGFGIAVIENNIYVDIYSKQYENITEMINTCMKLLSNWITSDKRRINNILG